LSGIPPSGGTNRNAAIHKSLNKSLKQPNIGLELALHFRPAIGHKTPFQNVRSHDNDQWCSHYLGIFKLAALLDEMQNVVENYIKNDPNHKSVL